jgi:hypothetical protein
MRKEINYKKDQYDLQQENKEYSRIFLRSCQSAK